LQIVMRHHGRMKNVSTLIKRATKQIQASPAIDHWQDGREQDDAEVLLSHVMRITPDDLDFTAEVGDAPSRQFEVLTKRRVRGEPVALITGEFEFRDLMLMTRKGVFIPRYSSDLLVDEAVAFLRRRRGERIVVDLCTGAGAVPLAIANEVDTAKVFGVDISKDAVRLGTDNAKKLGISEVKFLAGDLLDPLSKSLRGRVCAITMHPPYVAGDEIADLPREILDWEPVHTLSDESDDGLGLVRRFAAEAPSWLAPRGRVFVELGPHIARKAATIFKRSGYADVAVERDDVGATRVVVATWQR
jgi:release factor glutamine methyltransferase